MDLAKTRRQADQCLRGVIEGTVAFHATAARETVNMDHRKPLVFYFSARAFQTGPSGYSNSSKDAAFIVML